MSRDFDLPVKNQVVLIEWIDICSDSRWLDPAEQANFNPTQAIAVGIVLSCDDSILRLAHNFCVEDGKCDVTVYPMGVVKKVRVLADGKEECREQGNT